MCHTNSVTHYPDYLGHMCSTHAWHADTDTVTVSVTGMIWLLGGECCTDTDELDIAVGSLNTDPVSLNRYSEQFKKN